MGFGVHNGTREYEWGRCGLIICYGVVSGIIIVSWVVVVGLMEVCLGSDSVLVSISDWVLFTIITIITTISYT